MCGISFYVSGILIPYLCGVWHMPHTTPLLQRMIPEVCEAYAARGKRQEARGKRQEFSCEACASHGTSVVCGICLKRYGVWHMPHTTPLLQRVLCNTGIPYYTVLNRTIPYYTVQSTQQLRTQIANVNVEHTREAVEAALAYAARLHRPWSA